MPNSFQSLFCFHSPPFTSHSYFFLFFFLFFPVLRFLPLFSINFGGSISLFIIPIFSSPISPLYFFSALLAFNCHSFCSHWFVVLVLPYCMFLIPNHSSLKFLPFFFLFTSSSFFFHQNAPGKGFDSLKAAELFWQKYMQLKTVFRGQSWKQVVLRTKPRTNKPEHFNAKESIYPF